MDPSEIPPKVRETLLVSRLPEPMRDRFVELLLSVSSEGEVTPGEVLFRIGDTSNDQGCLYISGALKITRADGEVRYIDGPDIVGEVQLFTPQAARTATVEVVFGGPALYFEWQELGAEAQDIFTPEELAKLRETIKECARMREQRLVVSVKALKQRR